MGIPQYSGPFGFPSSLIFDEMFKTFERPFSRLTGHQSDVDYVEKDDELMLYVRAPGYAKEDLSVEHDNGVIRVTGELKDEQRPTSLVASKIDYEFTIGSGYVVEDASHANGILAIRTKRVKKSEAQKVHVLDRAR